MQNLLDETIAFLARCGKETDNVVAVINGEQSGSWSDFIGLADFDYDNEYGGLAEISTELFILFDDHSWIERCSYESSEWWEYKESPSVPENAKPLTFLAIKDGL